MLTLNEQIAPLRYQAPLPMMVRVRQRFEVERVTDFEGDVARALGVFADAIRPGMAIAVGVGSRGIANLPRIVRAVGAELRRLGAAPYVIPAMGSHGGATAQEQRALLAELGVTEANVGMSIRGTMDVREVGRLENGKPVYWSEDALAADGVVVVNRVKPHTDFRGPIESGLAKMCAIGLGRQKGAALLHSHGSMIGLGQLMPEAARLIVGLGKILGGVAILENAYDETARIVGVLPSGIASDYERTLQAEAKRMMPSLPFDELDTLIIDEMGKNISGCGMDPNIIGRMLIFNIPEFDRPRIATIAVLDLTDESHGNAAGIGLADMTTRRVFEKINFEHTYINCMTSGISGIQRGQLPMVLPTDVDAISASILASGRSDPTQATVMRIPNTLKIGEVDISTTLLAAARLHPRLEILSEPRPMTFDASGHITSF